MSKRRSTNVAKASRETSRSVSYRVNVRLDREAKEKLALLEMQMEKSTSDVLRDAVALLFEHRSESTRRPTALAALVGKFKGPTDLSRNYKSYASDTLSQKHGRK